MLKKERYLKVEKILEENGENLKDFLHQLSTYKRKHISYENLQKKQKTRIKNRAKLKRQVIKRTRKFFMENHNSYAFLVDPQIAAKFRIICFAEKINPRLLLEALMNAFSENDLLIEKLMENINDYHIKKILTNSIKVSFLKRFKRIKKIIDFYNIPPEWWKKYADLKVDELDF